MTANSNVLVDLLTWEPPVFSPLSHPSSSSSTTASSSSATTASSNLINFKKPSLKVSSVLNKNKKLNGANRMIDGEEDTCWNSEGSPSVSTAGQTEAETEDGTGDGNKLSPQTITINLLREIF